VRELIADMFITLDGFTAEADGSQGWMRDQGGPEFGAFVHQVLSEPQVMVMGRRTYEIMANSWPQSAEAPAVAMNALPKLVFSRTLQEPLSWNNSRLAPGDLGDAMSALKQQEGPLLRTVGSVSLVRNMLALGLVDRLRLVVFPLVLGTAGTQPMFENWRPVAFALEQTRVLDANILVLEYRLAG
jgi:dihydrofolate reductase